MRHFIVIGFVSVALIPACGGGVGVDPGDGSRTLLVQAEVDLEDGNADMHAKVQRAGQDVTDAQVIFESDLGAATLTSSGGADYNAVQAGWADGYRVEVQAGEDWLEGSIEAPQPPTLVSPNPAEPLDPQAAEGGVVLLQWDGEQALRVRVKVNDFDWEGKDVGELAVPATAFDSDSTDIEIKRINETPLVGGIAGSRLRISIEHETQVVVTNDF